MTSRLNYAKFSPESYKSLLALDKSISAGSLDRSLVDLVKIRVSQINGCLFCLDLHTKEARTHGERELRLHHLAFWRESVLFDDKEKAALAWAELLTKIQPHGIEDADFKNISAQFSEQQVSDLTFVINNINIWNRFGIAFRPTPGDLDKLYGVEKIGLV